MNESLSSAYESEFDQICDGASRDPGRKAIPIFRKVDWKSKQKKIAGAQLLFDLDPPNWLKRAVAATREEKIDEELVLKRKE